MAGMLALRGPRVVLREIQLDDVTDVVAYSADPRVHRFQPWGPDFTTEARVYVEHAVAAAHATPRSEYVFALTLPPETRLRGTVWLRVSNPAHGQAEVGYFLHPDVWGRGYATEAARLVVHLAFAELGVHRVIGTCDPRNAASARVLQKLGMRYEGRLRHTMRLRDGWRDSDVYSVLEHEWQHEQRGSPSMLQHHDMTAAAGFLCRSLARIVASLDNLTAEEQRWRPPAAGANSLLAIAAHALANAEDNVLGLLGGEHIERRREIEFDDRDLTLELVHARWAGLQPQLMHVLHKLPASALAATVDHPRRGCLSRFEVLLVALRHAAEHQGQAELTRDLVLARREPHQC
jgi:RimJ/RimL family protein N-acetyltransferase